MSNEQKPDHSRRPELTVKEYAATERVSERTVRRWIEDQAVYYRRTPGGQYRIDPTKK